VYIADTKDAAVSDPEASFMRQFKRLGSQLTESVGASGADQLASRQERAQLLGELNWEQVLAERVVVGTPEMAIDRVRELQEALHINTLIGEFNAGEQLPAEAITRSLRLFCEKVAPAFR